MRGRQLAFDFLNPAFDETLTVFGRIVFGVLAQVTLGTRFGNGLDHGGTVHSFEAVQLVLEFFGTAFGDRDG